MSFYYWSTWFSHAILLFRFIKSIMSRISPKPKVWDRKASDAGPTPLCFYTVWSSSSEIGRPTSPQSLVDPAGVSLSNQEQKVQRTQRPYSESQSYAQIQKRKPKYRVMELALASRTSNHAAASATATTTATSTASFSGRNGAFLRFSEFPARKRRLSLSDGNINRVRIRCAKASTERSSEGIEGRKSTQGGVGGSGRAGGFTGSAMEVTTFNQSFGDSEFPVWERIGAVVRLSYGIGSFCSLFT